MVRYKSLLNGLFRFNSGWLEVSSLVVFHIHLTDEIASSLNGKFDDLDYTLELVINPEKRTFSRATLVKRYNYPTADLRSIDEDYF